MVTQKEAQKIYETARDELLEIVSSYDATEEQINKAAEAAQKLADDFIGKEIIQYEKLSQSYQNFIIYMKGAISSLEKKGPIGVVTGLNDTLRTVEPLFSDDNPSDT